MRAALRDDPIYIPEQIGHRDPAFTFRMYQRAAKRREKLSESLLATFDRTVDWARMGTETQTSTPTTLTSPPPLARIRLYKARLSPPRP